MIFDTEETIGMIVHYSVLRMALETIANSPEMDKHVEIAQKALQKINEVPNDNLH